jgi:hypothetical protein
MVLVVDEELGAVVRQAVGAKRMSNHHRGALAIIDLCFSR